MNFVALLVVDVQCGAFSGELCPAISGGDLLLTNVKRLIEGARRSKSNVVFVQHSAGKGDVLEQGLPGWEIHPALRKLAGDPIVEKCRSSAFEGTDLDQILQRLEVRSLVVCGLQSELCISSTALSALERGYEVVVVAEAHGTRPGDSLTAEQIVQHQNQMLSEKGAILKSTEEVIRDLRGGNHQ